MTTDEGSMTLRFRRRLAWRLSMLALVLSVVAVMPASATVVAATANNFVVSTTLVAPSMAIPLGSPMRSTACLRCRLSDSPSIVNG
jgi:hypothetical protein